MPVSFAGAPMDLTMLIENSSRELLAAVDELDSTGTQKEGKALVIDPTLSGPMANIVEMAILKDHGVNKTLHLKAGPLQLEQKQIVYIVRANIPNMYMVAEQIRSLPPGRPYEIHLVQVPRRSAYCERVLEEEGVCNDMSFGELDLGFIPVEQDVISMEDPEAFRQTKLMGDKTHLFYVARALMHLQIVTGIIRDIRGMGSDAKMVAEMMIKLRAELGMMDEEHECDQAISTLVLIDRESDMITPMLTQLTYGGMLDDMFGIKDGVANIPGKLVPGKHQYTADAHLEHRVPLNPSDPVFVSVRDLPLKDAEPALKRSLYAGESSSVNTSGFGGGDQDDFFSGDGFRRESDVSVNASQQPAPPAAEQRIKLHTALVQHLLHTHTQHATFIRQVAVEHALIQGSVSYEEAMEFIDEMLYRRQPFARVIRFLSLVSGLCGGLRRFSHYKHELLQAYGFEYLFALDNLEKGGLLKGNNNTASVTSFVGASRTLASKAASVAGITATKATDSHWDTVVRALDIVPYFTDDKRQDSTFVDAGLSDIFGGIVPVTVRLVQKALFPPEKGWLSLEGTLKDVPGGNLFEAYQPTGREKDDRRVMNVLVMFVGGITLPEIAGVRFLAKHYNDNRRAGSAELRLLIGTSRIAGGDTLIHDLADVQKNMIKDFQLNLGK